MVIDSCQFGRMTISGRLYTRDLLLLPPGEIIDQWWRKQGHRFDLQDLEALLTERLHHLVIGTGISGRMRPAAELADQLSDRGIKLIAQPTRNAAQIYNELAAANHFVGAGFHLTC